MERALIEWFHLSEERISMSGDIVKQKRSFFLDRFYTNKNFNFSNGWLKSFKNRHHISSTRRSGQSGSVDTDILALALPSIQAKLDAFNLKDIYNMYETGLQYRMLIEHSLSSRQLEACKQGEECVSAVVCANGDDSLKLPLWIIGKFGIPRCFKNINLDSLNLKYRANKKIW